MKLSPTADVRNKGFGIQGDSLEVIQKTIAFEIDNSFGKDRCIAHSGIILIHYHLLLLLRLGKILRNRKPSPTIQMMIGIMAAISEMKSAVTAPDATS